MTTELTPAQLEYLRSASCDHNVIPVRIRFRSRWICVRCDQVFSTPSARRLPT